MPSDFTSYKEKPSSWVPLENRQYRRDVVYDRLSWNLQPSQLASAISAAAANGGPLAIIPDAGWGLSFSLAVYTLSGRLISRFERLRDRTVPPFRAVAIGWAFDDSLTVVYNDGVVVRLGPDLHPSTLQLVRAFPDAVNERVYDAAVLPSKEVIMRTASGKILSIDPRDSVRTDTTIVPPPEGVVRDVPNCGIASIKLAASVAGGSANANTKTNLNINANVKVGINSKTSTGMVAPSSPPAISAVDTLFVTANGNLIITNCTSQPYTLECKDDVSQIAISANGSYVAALDANKATLFVSTLDLRNRVANVNLAVELSLLGVENVFSDVVFDPKAPEAVAWVGSDAVAVLYREHLVLVGPQGGVAVLQLDEACANCAVILHTEVDGLRIISAVDVQFVGMVPEAVTLVRTHKQSPGFKLLCSSSTASMSKSIDTPKVNQTSPTNMDSLTRYRLLRELRDSHELIDGARQCVAAAYLETNVNFQKRLLHAAAYGSRHATVFGQGVNKPNGGDYSRSESKIAQPGGSAGRKKKYEVVRNDLSMIPTSIAILRVLNAVRAPSVGIPVTKPQFDMLGLGAIVDRLSRYGEHTLALRLATFGGVPVYGVLAEWASATIRANSGDTDEALTVLISDRFETVRRSQAQAQSLSTSSNRFVTAESGRRLLPYVRAAETAFTVGRPKCAELLLRREIRPAPKVEMYLRMGREGAAIQAAVESGDPELVLDAILHVLERKSVRETARVIRSLLPAVATRATDLLATHLRQIGNMNALRLVLSEAGRIREATLVEIGRVHNIQDTSEYIASLEKVASGITRGARGHARRVCHFELAALQHAATVATCALEVEKRGRLESGILRHASDGDLLARAIVDIHDKTRRRDMLAKLRRELKVPDRRFFWVCLESMAEVGDFESIEALSDFSGSGRAPPIGLMAFVDTCIKHSMEEEAFKYAMRMPDLRDRARALARCGRGREAADIASRLRNQQLLAEVQDLTARHVANINLSKERSKDTGQKASKQQL